jgi:Ca2+-binding RTX toxin-like protein
LGANNLVSRIGSNEWNITGINAGNLHNITFTNVQNLSGHVASFADRFHFNNGAAETSSIHGGSGPSYFAVLDYSKYTTPVIVDLKLNLALAGGLPTNVLNIKDVIGGSGNNILVGDVFGGNFLQGGSGRDILMSGGGPLGSTLKAGSGQAVMIGAHCVFDTNLVALNHLMAEWSHTYSLNPFLDFQIRVHHLEFGGGFNDPFRLIPLVTVIPQPGVTTLIDGAGPDFLWIEPGDSAAPKATDAVRFV